MTTPTPPRLTFLGSITVDVGAPVEVGPAPEGYRRIIPIVGGTVEGPQLRGRVLPAGADFQTLRTDTMTELQAEYAIETDDGERIYISNFGLRSGSPEDIAKLVRGEHFPPRRIYFRCNPRMTSNAGPGSIPGSSLAPASATRTPSGWTCSSLSDPAPLRRRQAARRIYACSDFRYFASAAGADLGAWASTTLL